MLANIVLQFFLKGGPVMWPILVSAIVAVAVVGERAFWWWRESQKRDPQKMEQLLAALEFGIGKNPMLAYLVEMAVRLVELHRVLKPTGSL